MSQLSSQQGNIQQQNRRQTARGGNRNIEPRTKTREHLHRQPAQTETNQETQASFGQSARLGQTDSLLQRQLPKPSLPVATHTTLRPAATLAPTSSIIQPKLQVNEPNDPYEVEADRVADQVMRMPAGDLSVQLTSGWNRHATIAPKLQLKCAACGGEDETAMRSHHVESAAPQVTPAIERNTHRMQGGGKPLDDNTRTFFEQRMGADFSSVRIHTDANAIQTSRDINARAFTTGNNIAFNSGEYNPNTSVGKHLLAHELTHTIQQQAAIQRESNDEGLPAIPGEVRTPSAGLMRMPVKFTHPGQWYDLDREHNPAVQSRSFWKASVHNAMNLEHQAYKTIEQRHAFYKFASAYLNQIDGATRSQWFKAAAIVTDEDALGAADKDEVNVWYLSDDAEAMLQTANAFLFEHNMKNFRYLMLGQPIPGMEGLTGKSLDHALVEFEQTKVQEFLQSYQPPKGSDPLDDMVDKINYLFDPWLIDPMNLFDSDEVNEVIETHFNDKDINFDFAQYKHRVMLGKELVNNLYRKLSSKGAK